ncbi:unnamed protein product [Tenebrio molitor]|nr:unnamed protein product [Tenebrio molitor]
MDNYCVDNKHDVITYYQFKDFVSCNISLHRCDDATYFFTKFIL